MLGGGGQINIKLSTIVSIITLIFSHYIQVVPMLQTKLAAIVVTTMLNYETME